MNNVRETINTMLVKTFHEILELEEKAIITDEFSDISNNDMHIIEAIGLGEGARMSVVAKRLNITVEPSAGRFGEPPAKGRARSLSVYLRNVPRTGGKPQSNAVSLRHGAIPNNSNGRRARQRRIALRKDSRTDRQLQRSRRRLPFIPAGNATVAAVQGRTA